jgi:hypothetical protein
VSQPLAESAPLRAPLEIEFDYTRSLGPVLSQFMAALAERRLGVWLSHQQRPSLNGLDCWYAGAPVWDWRWNRLAGLRVEPSGIVPSGLAPGCDEELPNGPATPGALTQMVALAVETDGFAHAEAEVHGIALWLLLRVASKVGALG